MTDVNVVSNAQHQRSLLDAQRRLDQQRADVIRGRLNALSDAQRRRQISAQRVELEAQRNLAAN